ncbi:hypothetical protein K474DRAFT_1593590 [Panus rudis PR-1116 ss-1]|nr:hypothetical protein K474DRAFT_1593590 [Panus rudis PR-1116 ss-1]
MSRPVTKARGWGPIQSLLLLSPLLLGAPWFAYRKHYSLPEPVTELINPTTSLPQISEAQILTHARHLSEEIGYRTVGTREHALGDAYMVEQANELKRQCDEIVKATPDRQLECEVWRQEGSGNHRFDIMGKRLYKTYRNLSNIIVRVSDGTERGKENAVLVNSHVDSTLPSPGAADDALAVGVMLECIRNLIYTPGWEPSYAIIFLFNNAEESLQDGSHLYSTQHHTAKSVRAAINLEAAGTTGPELLFQATSEEMIKAYSKVPRPFGTILANEIFSSGILMSDTDFRQFELYLNVTGLDMAVVGNSYLYHTRLDLVENIEAGVAQHMAENTLALLQYLSSPESPLPSLTAGYSKPTTVFYEAFGHFWVYSYQTAKILYSTLLVVSTLFIRSTFVPPAPALRQGRGFVSENLRGLKALCLGLVGSLLGANFVAFIMRNVLDKGMSWFSVELSCLLLYGPAALTGTLASQLLIGHVREQTVFSSLVLSHAFLACTLQLLGIGSSAVFFLSGLPLFLAYVANTFLVRNGDEVSLWSYAIGQFVPLTTGTRMVLAVLDVFVPLTGRMGEQAPGDHIIATIVAVTGSYMFPLAVPFIHRFPRRALLRVLLVPAVMTSIAIAAFAARQPFDRMHPKRFFVLHMENVTSNEQHLHFAAADGAPGFKLLAHDIAMKFGMPDVPPPSTILMDDWNADWDIIYPFSAFLTPYKIDLPPHPELIAAPKYDFALSAVNDTIDAAAGTRSFTLVVKHTGIIWTVIAFDAHVLQWSLDNNPPKEHARHHIKEGSFYGHDIWTADFTIKLPENDTTGGKIKVNFAGIDEKSMWPGKKAIKQQGGRAMKLFEEIDEWLDKEKGGVYDATLAGCVGGVAWI